MGMLCLNSGPPGGRASDRGEDMRRCWRKNSEFGEGRRVPLDREQRAVLRARLRMPAFRGPGRLTANAVEIGKTLLDMLGKGGELFPSIETLRQRIGVKS